MQTVYKIKTVLKDSIRTDTLHCVEYKNNWIDFVGCYNKQNEFEGTIESRDSLIYEEHIIPKRFLGFLWKYGCKERRQNIVSRNPYTKIVSTDFITKKD